MLAVNSAMQVEHYHVLFGMIAMSHFQTSHNPTGPDKKFPQSKNPTKTPYREK